MMQPVLRRGRSYLDRELLPGDENEARLQALLDQAAEQGLAGVVIFAAAHTPENLDYYANYIPTTFHGTLIARRGTPPTLIAGKGGARDHPYIRTVSWVADIRYAAELGETIAEITADWGGSLGVAGLDTSLPHEVRAGVVAALDGRITPIDDLVAQQRRSKSARELVVLQRANDLARAAASAAVESYRAGAGRRSALAAADYAARAGNAHDCRVTVGTERGGSTRSSPWSTWVTGAWPASIPTRPATTPTSRGSSPGCAPGRTPATCSDPSRRRPAPTWSTAWAAAWPNCPRGAARRAPCSSRTTCSRSSGCGTPAACG
jgi:hypothetical protein